MNRIVSTKTTRTSGEKGTAILETAATLLVSLLLILGILEGARMLWMYNTLAYLSREGARYGAVHGSDSGSEATADTITTYVRGKVVGVPSSSVTVNTTWPSGDKDPGSYIQVQTQYTFVPVTGLFKLGAFTITTASKQTILH